MSLRKGIYVVPTDRWYIERTVWLIAGLVLITGTLLAVLVDPRWILLLAATGLVSINVALTGFCPVGNLLKWLGFKPALSVSTPTHWNLYWMQTDSWYLERRIYMTVGINVSLAAVLVLVHSPWWGVFTGFVGLAMVSFAATGYCILANVLYRIGAEPRLNPAAVAVAPRAAARRPAGLTPVR